MPDNWLGWVMFAYFFLGAGGGLLVWVLLGIDIWKSYRKLR